MSMAVINTHEAKTRLSQLLDRACKGEEIIIARNGRPIVRLVALEAQAHPRAGGQWQGLVHVADDFEAPLPADIEAAFRGHVPPRQP